MDDTQAEASLEIAKRSPDARASRDDAIEASECGVGAAC